MKFNYSWNLKDANFTGSRGSVFSCFSCGGGSTMGYKLAGFDVIGCLDIDHRMMEIYKKNHNPKYAYEEGIQTFKLRDDLPEELYNLDILDGSPPCSTFTMTGDREKSWGVKRHFREGQQEQVLDTLFFDFIDLAEKLKPKVVVAENVKGILIANAMEYTIEIHKSFKRAGYYSKHFVLNSETIGVPQKRERVFFVAIREDLAQPFLSHTSLFDEEPTLDLTFNEEPILFGEVADYLGDEITSPSMRMLWEKRIFGDRTQRNASERLYKKRVNFGRVYAYENEVAPTLMANKASVIHFSKPLFLSQSEVCKISTFPQDYDFCGKPPHYVCGMCVPPVMMAQVAQRIFEEWLRNLVE